MARDVMKQRPAREAIPPHPQQSFRSLSHDFPSEIAQWNSHPELEIHVIRAGAGTLMMGDYIGTFEAGQVFLVGSNLPHDWVSHLAPGEVIKKRDGVVQFDIEWLQRCVAVVPELAELQGLVDDAKRGLAFRGETARKAAIEIDSIIVSHNSKRIGHMFRLLSILKNAPGSERQILASELFGITRDTEADSAVEAGIAYIFENLTKQIRMSEAAKRAHMSEPMFSKYFRRASGLTFSDLVKKVRIAHACHLLDTTDKPMATVCLESGYTNVANFNRQFLAEMGMTPSTYRRLDAALKPHSRVLSLGLDAPRPK